MCPSFHTVARDLGFPPPGGIFCIFCLGTCFCSWLLPPAILFFSVEDGFGGVVLSVYYPAVHV